MELPISNRRSTILAATIPFQVIASCAVILRTYARIRVVRRLGWDDAFVVLAWATNFVGNTFVYISTTTGLGEEWDTLLKNPHELRHYLKVFYVANATYACATGFVKISLLFQYLRLPAFDGGVLRRCCQVLLILVGCWTAVMTFMSWFPCFPVDGYWSLNDTSSTCYGFGARNKGPFSTTYEAQVGTNAVLDIAVLFLPLVPYLRRGLSQREVVGVTTLSCIGLSVIAVALAHLGALIQHDAGWKPTMNLTYYAPLPIILALIEVNLAVLAASIPIFWPVIEAGVVRVFVTQEVSVTTAPVERRGSRPGGNEFEMMDDARSFRTNTDDSEAGLRHKEGVVDYSSGAFPWQDDEPLTPTKSHGHITHIEARRAQSLKK